MKEIDPQITNRAQQFEIWKNAPNPMLVFVKLVGNDNKDVRQGRDKYIEKSERTYFQYVPTIQIR